MLIEYGTIFFNIRTFPLMISRIRITLKNKFEIKGAMFNIFWTKINTRKTIYEEVASHFWQYIVAHYNFFTLWSVLCRGEKN